MAKLLVGESLVVPPLRRHWIVVVRQAFALTVSFGAILALIDVIGFAQAVGWIQQRLPECRGSHIQASGVMAQVTAQSGRLTTTLIVLAVYWIGITLSYFRWMCDQLWITDQRIVRERGVVFRRTRVFGLDRLVDIRTSQTLLGEVLNYGTLAFRIAQAPTQRYRLAWYPEMLRDQVFVLSEQHRRSL